MFRAPLFVCGLFREACKRDKLPSWLEFEIPAELDRLPGFGWYRLQESTPKRMVAF